MTSAKRPNLFIIGAMKSGTTSLHGYLGAHPSIFMSHFKEPSYFCPESLVNDAQTRALNLWRGEAYYLELFSTAAGQAQWIGESSTHYSKYPQAGIAEAIARFNPEARIIYLLRDPVERTISHYWYHVSLLHESRYIMSALQDDCHYSDVSHYARQFLPYMQSFGAHQIKVITFEKLIRDPLAVISKIFAWLNVDASFVPPNIGMNENRSPRFVIQKSSPDAPRMNDPAEIIPDIFTWLDTGLDKGNQGVAGKREEKALQKNIRVLDRQKLDTQKAIDFLRPIQLEQTRALSGLLSRDFPEWTTLYG